MKTIIGGNDFDGVDGDDGGNDDGDDDGNDVDDDGSSCCLGLGVLGAAEVGKLISPPPTKPHLSSSPFFLILNFSL